MPPVSSAALVRAITAAIEESGASATLLSHPGRNPREFLVTRSDGSSLTLWVYVWTLTRGGRSALPHEYRIQLTGVRPPLAENPDGRTALMGYEPESRMFAGFDLQAHRNFSLKSPSVQIDVRKLYGEGLQQGLAFDVKGSGEIAVGVRPDLLLAYIDNALDLHRDRTGHLATLLGRAITTRSISKVDLEGLSEERARVLAQTSRLVRDANFSRRVLEAYGYRCAVTRVQLRLLDAAHILPVEAKGSVDDIRNGLALSPTYHRAYDRGLIFLDEEWVMRVHLGKQQELQADGLGDGLDWLSASLGRVHLPSDRRQWPDRELIRKANLYRKIRV